MTEVDTIVRLEVNDPCKEVILCTFSDGETYTSRKFGVVRAVQATLNEDNTTLTYPVSLAISGNITTIHCTGVSDKIVCLTLYGDK